MIYFLSILDGEFIKIGYTSQKIEKRKAALQTGNPYEIKLIFRVDGTLKQEKEVHRSLEKVFERLKVFNNPVNEWYPGENSIIKMFMANAMNLGIDYAIRNIDSIYHWEFDVKENEIFNIRSLEKALKKRGFSNKQAKKLISQNKIKLMASSFSHVEDAINEMV